jgi:hypothetical protein
MESNDYFDLLDLHPAVRNPGWIEVVVSSEIDRWNRLNYQNYLLPPSLSVDKVDTDWSSIIVLHLSTLTHLQ